MKKIILTTAIFMATALSAFAQPQCGDRSQIIETLLNNYGETQQSVALSAQNDMIETYASLETGTWSILATSAQGRTCLVAHGINFSLTPQGVDA